MYEYEPTPVCPSSKDGGEEQAWLKAYRENRYIFIF